MELMITGKYLKKKKKRKARSELKKKKQLKNQNKYLALLNIDSLLMRSNWLLNLS